MGTFSKLPKPTAYSDKYTGPDIWINFALVAYVHDAFPSAGQTVNLNNPVTVKLISPMYRVPLASSEEMVAFNVVKDPQFPKGFSGMVQVNTGLIAGISTTGHEAVTNIHLLDDQSPHFSNLVTFQVEGIPQYVAKQLGIELA